jgi:hypothetical protein
MNYMNYNFVSVFFSDYRSAPFAQRPGMAENVRGLLSFADKQSAELHGGKNDSIKKHDVRLVWDIVFGTVVGKVMLMSFIILPIIVPARTYICTYLRCSSYIYSSKAITLIMCVYTPSHYLYASRPVLRHKTIHLSLDISSIVEVSVLRRMARDPLRRASTARHYTYIHIYIYIYIIYIYIYIYIYR